MKRVYIAGKITGDPNYREKFAKAEKELRDMGYTLIMNPAVLPEGFTWDDYMNITLAMLSACNTIYLIDGWEDSRGAQIEAGYAESWKYTTLRQNCLNTPKSELETPNKNND